MAMINSYLNFDGNTEEAFDFYKSVFGGEFVTKMRFSELPSDQMGEIPEADKNKLMHISLPIRSGSVLMGSDSMECMGHKFVEGNNISLSINAENEADADTLFNGLSAGGKVTMAMNKTFWNAYFGMFTDKFGIQWMVNYDYN